MSANKKRGTILFLCYSLLFAMLSGCGTDLGDPETKPDDAQRFIADMTLDEKIFQMFFVTPEALTGVGTVIAAGETTKNALLQYPVGGIIYFGANIKTYEQVSGMIANTQQYSKIPLFIGVDEEGGAVARISGNADMGFPKIEPMARIGETGDTKKAFDTGKTIAENIKGLGFNVAFAPVADIITNPKNTEIGDRSFGNDTALVAEMTAQVILGLQENGVCSVLKHFPGHGSTETNSHNGYSESRRTIEEMRNTEFVPFKKGMDAGAEFVLISHMSAINVDDSGHPASLSKKIITEILKNELGFQKLVITDSLSMGAITSRYSSEEAAVSAILAGVDILLMPQDLQEAYSGVKKAVSDGRISEECINESVLKIIETKIAVGII